MTKQQIDKKLLNPDSDEIREAPLSEQESTEIIELWEKLIGSFVTMGFDLKDLPLETLRIMAKMAQILEKGKDDI